MVEAKDGQQNTALIKKRWTGMPPFVNTFIITEPLEYPTKTLLAPTETPTTKIESANEMILIEEPQKS